MREPNRQLADVMRRAGCSNSGLANRVAAIAAEHGIEIHCDHISVRRWLNGMVPRGMTCQFIAQALGRKLGSPVTLAEIGMDNTGVAAITAAAQFPEQLADSITAISGLVRADLAGAAMNGTTGFDPAGWSDVMVRWLVAPDLVQPVLPTVALPSAVQAVISSTSLFSQLDYQYGGGYARTSLVSYIDTELAPLLAGPHGQSPELLRAAGALLRLVGWTAYDTGHHDLASRYLTQALRLAQGAGDPALGGRILANMSHQANFLGYHDQAANLARAAQRRATGKATPTAMALFCAMEARALAGRGDRHGCEVALLEADRWFAKRVPDDDPSWLRYFDQAELAAEFAHSYRDLGMYDRAVKHAHVAVDEADPMYVRSISFCRTVLAAGHLGRGEIEPGLALADQVVSTAVVLRSGRCVAYVQDFMRRLDPYSSHQPVAEFIERTRAVLPGGSGAAC